MRRKLKDFRRELRSTYRSLSFPTRNETIKLTAFVFVVAVIASLLLALIHLGMTNFLSLFIRG